MPAELTSRVPSYEIRDMLDRLAIGADDPEAVNASACIKHDLCGHGYSAPWADGR